MEKLSAFDKMQSETPFFQNVCHYTVSNIYKFQLTFLLKNPIFYLLPVSVLLCILVKAYQIALFVGIFSLVYYIFIPVLYYVSAKKTVERIKERNFGKNVENTVTFTENALYNTASGNTIGIEYGAVKKVMSFKDCYYIVTKTNQAFLVSKEGFTMGDAAAFPAFLKEKTGKKVRP